MIPEGLNVNPIKTVIQPNLQHKMDIENSYVIGKCDGKEGLKQSIYKILSTERYENVIYSRNYGVEFKDIFGQPVTTVLPIIESRIKEALLQDDRINSVDNFVFDTSKKHIVSVSFKVHSIIGDIEMSKEVAV